MAHARLYTRPSHLRASLPQLLSIHRPRPHRHLSPAHTHARTLTTSDLPRHPPRTTDRGPASAEDTQTDFAALDVLSSIPRPSYSVESVYDEGFTLDSRLRIGDGDGLLLVGSGAFVWRPWMLTAGEATSGENVQTGLEALKRKNAQRTLAGLLNAKMQFDVPAQAWGVLELLWPRPDLLIIGTGASIVPLAPAVRKYLLELGVRVDVLDSRNAASQFNLLATERGNDMIAAAMLPLAWSVRATGAKR